MKSKILIISLVILGLASCKKDNEYISQSSNYKSENQMGLRELPPLDEMYSIPEAVYSRFVDSLIYDSLGKLRGAYIEEIENLLSTEEQISLWGDMDIDVTGDEASGDDPTLMRFYYYKPKTNGCKRNKRWICFPPQ